MKLGTRRSLLAWAQSSWVAREIERLNPGIQVELVGIDTRGDKILDVSLQSIQGKEFFVAELDAALREGQVDCTVHSMKDLSLERPSEFVLAAVPHREAPQDVVFFGPRVLEKLRQGQALKIGTSSPRRLENIPAFLKRALPQLNSAGPVVEFVELRGNVNTRLSRLHEAESSAKHLDGVVLALAGITRLFADEKARLELAQLLKGVRKMVLPVSENPTAPAQGALAIECRAADTATRKALSLLHHEASSQEVAQEREVLSRWGGGCHQKFGATSRSLGVGMQKVSFLKIRGRHPDGHFVDQIEWQAPKPLLKKNGCLPKSEFSTFKKISASHEAAGLQQVGPETFVLIAHSRAVDASNLNLLRASEKSPRVWTAGVESWFSLAGKGVWIEGCAEGWGVKLLPQLSRVLQIPEQNQWSVLTHESARSTYPAGGQVLATYRVDYLELGAQEQQRLAQSATVYWSSGEEFKAWSTYCESGVIHACGPGKTVEVLISAGVQPQVFPTRSEWELWSGWRDPHA